MDVERIQKINALALDLMKKGLAQDREDAVFQAEQVFRNRDSENYAEMRGRMEEIRQADQKQDKKIEELTQGKIQEIMEQNTQFIVKKMREFQEKIDSLEKEMSQLRNQVTYQKLPTVKEIKKEEEIPKLGEIKSTGNEKQQPHPRSGNYKDADVSIEKFFYMGK